MANEILSYVEMCVRESASLQRGMNFDHGAGYSVILMSVRPNAPYRDRFEDDGSTLIYEGHDSPRSALGPEPKTIDQPGTTPLGRATQNGKFHEAAQNFKTKVSRPIWVRVYEKIHAGIWSYNGIFQLVDSWQEQDGKRSVFKFKLIAIREEPSQEDGHERVERRRIIPTAIKIEVWRRDNGRCVMCGATDELHFDHDLPYSRGGTSMKAENVQLLCARHNLSKGAQIQ